MGFQVVSKQILVTLLGAEVGLATASEPREQNLPELRLAEHTNPAAKHTKGGGWFALPTRPVEKRGKGR